MKRCWFGGLLLLVLLLFGCFTTWRMQNCYEPVLRNLDQAAQAASREEWNTAEGCVADAKAGWEKHWGLSAAMTDHTPMEQVNALFAELEVYGENREAVAFRSACAQLIQEVSAIGEAHGLSWWNLM